MKIWGCFTGQSLPVAVVNTMSFLLLYMANLLLFFIGRESVPDLVLCVVRIELCDLPVAVARLCYPRSEIEVYQKSTQ